jgi:hypothetical protein|tara:strand:- start:10947 stop:11222 length:276 start_codon:yes stop_codon:yes gene_type:complete
MNKLIKEIQFHLKELDKGNIDKDDFVNAITEICSEESPQAVEDPTWEFDNSSPIIHLDEDGNELKDSPLSNPLDNHFKTMASMVRNLTKNK